MNKKFFLCLCLTVLCSVSAFAGRIDQEKAKQQAVAFFTQQQETKLRQGGRVTPVQPRLVLTDPQGGYYVFNADDEQSGFVVVAGSDHLESTILGYSDTGSFTTDEMPENLQYWLQSYADYVAAVEQGKIVPKKVQHMTSMSAVAPLLKSQWDQNHPFNNQLQGSSVTGCVATCLAQLMYYYKYPETVQAMIPAWTSQNGYAEAAVAKGTTIQWNSMKDTYNYNDASSNTANDAVAALMKMCGQALRMNWSATNSGANSVGLQAALRQYFGYSMFVHGVPREGVTDEEWEEIIYNELANNRPVAYSAISDSYAHTGGVVTSDGHSFICDGYNSDGYFHMNWGWGGHGDGYYLLSNLNPPRGIGGGDASHPFNYAHSILIGIQPDPTAGSLDMPLATTGGLGVYENTFPITATRSSSSQNFSFTQYLLPYFSMRAYFDDNGNTFMDVGLGIYRDNDLLHVAREIDNYEMRGLFANPSANNVVYYQTSYFGITINVPASLSNGTYKIYQICRPAGTSEWYRAFGSNVINLDLTISGNTATIDEGGYSGLENYLEDSPVEPTPPEPQPTHCTVTVKAHDQTVGQGTNTSIHFTYDLTVEGDDAGLTGEPYVYVDDESFSVPGTYTIHVEQGTLTCDADEFEFVGIEGTLTVEAVEIESYPIAINGEQVNSQNCLDIASAMAGVEGTVNYSPSEQLLILQDATINSLSGGAVAIGDSEDTSVPVVFVQLEGDNHINSCVVIGNIVQFYGPGQLTINAENTDLNIAVMGDYLEFAQTTATLKGSVWVKNLRVFESHVTFDGTLLVENEPELVNCHFEDPNIRVSSFDYGGTTYYTLVDENGQDVSYAVILPGATGIEPTAWDGMNETAIYNLQGQRVLHPSRGIYIVNGKKLLY